jgi:hypothetical protein
MMNPFSSRCCQHNHAAGWIYYVENSWMATPDDGLAAQLYGESEVRARVGDGTDVRLVADTRYPFEEQVRITVESPRPVVFPLYLRIPRWCSSAALRINGQRIAVAARPGEYLRIARRWRSNDRVVLDLPMELGVREWRKNKNSVSVDYGPLTFSLAIAERYVQRSSTETVQRDARWQEGADASRWPAFEIQPASAWNYGPATERVRPAQLVHRRAKVVAHRRQSVRNGSGSDRASRDGQEAAVVGDRRARAVRRASTEPRRIRRAGRDAAPDPDGGGEAADSGVCHCGLRHSCTTSYFVPRRSWTSANSPTNAPTPLYRDALIERFSFKVQGVRVVDRLQESDPYPTDRRGERGA